MQLYPDNTNPRFFAVTGGEEYDSINFVVVPRPASQISGMIQVPDGVKGQFQLALALPEQPALSIAQTLSEKEGSYRFEKIPPGNYDLFVAGPVNGYGMFSSTLGNGDSFFGRTRVQVSGQNVESLNIAVSAAKSLRVLLRGQGGGAAPAGCPASADITLTSLEPWAILWYPGAAATLGKEQTIPNLAPGKFRIGAADLGNGCFQTNDVIADLNVDSPPPVTVELASAGSLHGHLRGGNSGSTVILTDALAGRWRADTCRLARCGWKLQLRRIAPGSLQSRGLPRGVRPRDKSAGKEIEVAGGAPTPVEINLTEVKQ